MGAYAARNAGNTERWDTVVVGSGVAGLAAAAEAAAHGMRVVVLEAETEPGGASAISRAGCCLVGTPLQAACGVPDSLELALRDWRRAGGPSADLTWAARYLADSCTEVFAWCEDLGIRWTQLRQEEGNSAPRWHLPEGGGPALIAALLGRCRSLGVTVRTSSPVTQIVHERGRARGVAVSAAHGGRVMADATIICTGGFTSNRAMLQRHAPALAAMTRFLCGGSAAARGAGHDLLSAAGAAFAGQDKLWMYPVGTPDPGDPSGSRGLVMRDVRSEIWLNRSGRRFHDEDLRGGLTGVPALLAQPGQTAWGIFDAREAARLTLLNDARYGSPFLTSAAGRERFWSTSRYAWRAPSIGELAAVTGLPAAPLAASVGKFNRSVRSGLSFEPEFGRELTGLEPIERPPFCAVQYFPLVQKNLSGVRTDSFCRVMKSDTAAMTGLYAAGEVAGMAGGCINGAGAIEGTMFGPCLYSGRIAGKSAACGGGGGIR
ncbi:MAG TPA: FAD-dependent oxidoreductase [Streptosporangiaceae bacterium]